jgi:hypothetical protein
MRTCSACGHEIVPGDDFCTNCGTWQVAARPARPEPEPEPEPPAPVTSLDGPPAPGQTAADSDGVAGAAEHLPRQTPAVTAFEETPADTGGATVSDLRRVAGAGRLLGEAPNAVYLGQRMLYEKDTQVLENLDPVWNRSYLRATLWHGLAVFLVYMLGQIVIVIVSAVLSAVNGRFGTVIGALAAIAWWLVMACVFWLSKVPAKLSEWKFLVDDQAAVAPVALDHIAWAFSRRKTPADYWRARRFPVMGQGSRDVLEVRQGVFYGLVSCFASGEDLFLGWTYWFSLSPARWLLIVIRRLFWFLRFRGSAIYMSLQFDRARALREALHSAVREGADVATGQLAAQGQGTIGSRVPVVTDESAGDPSWRWLAEGS